MRKVPNQVASGFVAEFPAGGAGETHDVVVQLAAGQIQMLPEIRFAAMKCRFDVRHQLVLGRICAQRIGSAEVRFERLEHRPKIQVHNIIILDASILRFVVVGEHGIGTGTGDAFVPVTTHTKTALRECVNIGADFALELAWRNNTRFDDRGK